MRLFSKYVFLWTLLCVPVSAKAYLRPLSPEDFNALYRHAAQGNVSILNNAVWRGLNIDSVNEDGDTGLCIAAKYKNKKAFRSFVSAGANQNHPCTLKISDYQQFKNEAAALPSIRNQDEVKLLTGETDKMPLSTKIWIGAGVVAAGGVTAALLGGGGGGSSGSKCVHGTWDKDSKTCECQTGYIGAKCTECDEGYDHFGAEGCYLPIACGDKGHQVGGRCACEEGYAGEVCNVCANGYGRNSAGICSRLSPDVHGVAYNINYNNTSGNISVDNEDYARVYGLFYDSGKTMAKYYLSRYEFANTYAYIEKPQTSSSEEDIVIPVRLSKAITINNHSDSNVFAMYSTNSEQIYNDYLEIEGGIVQGYANADITITNKGDGNIYGIYGSGDIYNGEFNSAAEEGKTEISNVSMLSNINITNEGNGNAYGIYNTTEDGNIYNLQKYENYVSLQSSVSVLDTGNGNVYGLFAKKGTVTNTGKVNTSAEGGNAYGIYVQGGTIDNTRIGDETIESVISSSTTGNAYGLYADEGSIENGRWIKTSSVEGNAYGIYGNQATLVNSSKIDASSDTGNAYGIYNIGGSVQNTTQRYDVTAKTNSGSAYGIYSDGGTVTNSGHIWVEGPQETTYGIYATNGATVVNEGDFEITVNNIALDSSCSGEITQTCYTKDGIGKAIYIDNDAVLVNAGKLKSTSALNLNNSAGSGQVKLAQNGSFEAPEIKGEISIDTSVVSNGFKETYALQNAIKTDNAAGLTLKSDSALFEAKLQGSDVMLEKKDFKDITGNNTLANFLEKNYSTQNNEQLYTNLKQAGNLDELSQNLTDLTGQSLTRFAFEDMLLYKEFNFEVNEKLFQNTAESFMLSGVNMPALFNNTTGSLSRYMVSGQKYKNGFISVGMAINDTYRQAGQDKDSKTEHTFELSAPMGYTFSGFSSVITPKMAYSYGYYDRTGFNGQNYEGKIEKKIFGMMSQIRYPFEHKGWNFAPMTELNIIGYNLKGREDKARYSLQMPSQNIYSAELGFGLNIQKDFEFNVSQHLSLSNTFMFYHEFLSPYELWLKMNEMDGRYKLKDNNRQENRFVLKNSFDFNMESINIYGNLFSYIDSHYQARGELGFKWQF